METRKIQQVGGGTYTVSLPGWWATEHGVSAGDTAYLYPHSDGSLVVRWGEAADSPLASTRVPVPSDAPPRAAADALDAAYVAGFEEIDVSGVAASPPPAAEVAVSAPQSARGDGDGSGTAGPTAAQRDAVIDRARTLPGVDVAASSADHVAVRGLFDAADVSIRRSLMRLRFNALAAHEAAIDAVTASGGGVIERVEDRCHTADRTVRLIERYGNRGLAQRSTLDALAVSRPQVAGCVAAARALERATARAGDVAAVGERAAGSLDDDVARVLRGVSEDACASVDAATDALVEAVGGSSRVPSAHDARRQCARVRRVADCVERAALDDDAAAMRTPSTAAVAVRALDGLVGTADCGAAIAAVALRMAVGAQR
ncbi:phosphate uptake regulator PhoU [Halobacterium salinarum]|uniref:phosphate uptake regulator PhoU n=2 Tax=Halobacterium salinarum TaxID=2242 RepID=UPI001F41D5BD|nr:phosphate uptake regulator PhoU [Halobacterium salinarum]MCF2207248.1 phosphate uptake regulator PhoU [Halobacterium salinarum]